MSPQSGQGLCLPGTFPLIYPDLTFCQQATDAFSPAAGSPASGSYWGEGMKILGHGIDLMELARVQQHLSTPHGDWIDAVFSNDERAQADQPPREVEFFAGRYAAKEAVVKALGTGFSDNVAWLDVEIRRRPAGGVEVHLSGGADEIATALGVTRWLVSISHSGGYAVASAIALSD
jgi:holo-[acyl-carrier protein] synthase